MVNHKKLKNKSLALAMSLVPVAATALRNEQYYFAGPLIGLTVVLTAYYAWADDIVKNYPEVSEEVGEVLGGIDEETLVELSKLSAEQLRSLDSTENQQ